MTIKTTLKKFDTLKKEILKDGKVDYDEAIVLMDFIAPYCRAGNQTFMSLYEDLNKAVIDGHPVSVKTSNVLVAKIDNVSSFLKHERVIESWLSFAIIAISVAGVSLLALRHLF